MNDRLKFTRTQPIKSTHLIKEPWMKYLIVFMIILSLTGCIEESQTTVTSNDFSDKPYDDATWNLTTIGYTESPEELFFNVTYQRPSYNRYYNYTISNITISTAYNYSLITTKNITIDNFEQHINTSNFTKWELFFNDYMPTYMLSSLDNNPWLPNDYVFKQSENAYWHGAYASYQTVFTVEDNGRQYNFIGIQSGAFRQVKGTLNLWWNEGTINDNYFSSYPTVYRIEFNSDTNKTNVIL